MITSHFFSYLYVPFFFFFFLFFFFNDTATTEIYTLSLHDALPIFLTSQSRCHRQSKRPPLRFSPGPKGPTGVLVSAMLHHSTPHERPHDGGTDASAERRRELGVPPWAQHSSVLREEAAPCNRISVVRHDQHAPRPAPGDRDRPQRFFHARLAPKKKRSCARV